MMITGAQRFRGFSLIELMVAITLGLLLMLVMSRLMAQQSRAQAEIESSGRLIENGRYAVNLLYEDIQMAGYFGQAGGVLEVPAALPDPCEAGATSDGVIAIRNALALPIQGYNNLTSLPSALAACLGTANHVAGTDILIVRRSDAENTVVLPTGSVNRRLYVQATPTELKVGIGGNTAAATFSLMRKDATTPAELRRYVQRIYFISPCHVPADAVECDAAADNGQPIPTLKRLDLSETGFTVTPLVEGIENLQLEYGIDDSRDGAPERYETAPALAEWSDVVAVRVSLIARSLGASAGHLDDRNYMLGSDAVSAPGDAFKRQAYSVAVRAVNQSGRRE